jgi:hypothetical protein
MANQLGIAGSARKYGIPAATVNWTGPGAGAVARQLSIFTEITKTPMADINQSNGLTGELEEQNRKRKRIQLRFSAEPVGADAASAQAIGADLPFPMDLCTVIAGSDVQANCDNTGSDTTVVDSAEARWTQEGALVVDFTVTKWIARVFVALS